jgi:hypothetical protein
VGVLHGCYARAGRKANSLDVCNDLGERFWIKCDKRRSGEFRPHGNEFLHSAEAHRANVAAVPLCNDERRPQRRDLIGVDLVEGFAACCELLHLGVDRRAVGGGIDAASRHSRQTIEALRPVAFVADADELFA